MKQGKNIFGFIYEILDKLLAVIGTLSNALSAKSETPSALSPSRNCDKNVSSVIGFFPSNSRNVGNRPPIRSFS